MQGDADAARATVADSSLAASPSASPRAAPDGSPRALPNPFAHMGIPAPPVGVIGAPSKHAYTIKKKLDKIEDTLEKGFGRLMTTRRFDKRRDSSMAVAKSFREMVQVGGKMETGTFVHVPEGVGVGSEFVVEMPDEEGQYKVVTVPDDVSAGDVLWIRFTDDNRVELVDQVSKRMNLKPARVLVLSLSVCAVVLIASSVVLPNWLEAQKNGTVETFGPVGRFFHGYMQGWEQVQYLCTSWSIKGVDPSCATYNDLAQLGHTTITFIAIAVLMQLWAIVCLLFRRELLCFIIASFSLCVEVVVIANYRFHSNQAVERHTGLTPEKGISVWLFYAGISLGVLQALSALGLWWEAQRQSRLKILGVDVLGIQTWVFEKPPEEEYEWDETDPGAGCPIIWRTYGLTEAGVLTRYGNYWWGGLYAAIVYVLSVPAHFLKTFDWNGVRRVHFGPPSEEESVRKRGVTSTVVINYMLYRRSNIIMATVFTVPLLWWAWSDLWAQQQVMLDHLEAQQAGPHTWETYQQQKQAEGHNVTFIDYTGDVMKKAVLSVTVWNDSLAVLKYILRLCALLVAGFFAYAGMLRWGDFKASRYLLTFGWMAILVSPFLATFVPTRNAMSWDEFDQTLSRHLDEARVHYDVDNLALMCLSYDTPTLLESVKTYSGSACDMVSQYVPYAMPATVPIKIPALNSYYNMPVSSLPWIGKYMPEPGTDLSTLHSTCSSVRGIASKNSTQSVVRMIHDGCKEFGSYLQANSPTLLRSSMQDIQDTMAKPINVDPTHVMGATHMLIVGDYGDDHAGLPLDIPAQIGVAVNFPDARMMQGPLYLLRDGNQADAGPCGLFRTDAPAPTPGSEPFILVAAIRSKCGLGQFAQAAIRLGAAGLVVHDRAKLLKDDVSKSWSGDSDDLRIAILKSKVDGGILLEQLAKREGYSAKKATLSASVILAQSNIGQGNQYSRTSRGCRCKGRGYESECAVRDPQVFSALAAANSTYTEAYPWCETDDSCSVAYDVCVPPGALEAAQEPNRICLPEYPCRRLHADAPMLRDDIGPGDKPDGKHDVCVTAVILDGYIKDTFRWMNCVPPSGLAGVVTLKDGTQKRLKGNSPVFAAQTSHGEMKGMLLTSTLCSYRVAGLSASGRLDTSDSSARLRIGNTSLGYGQVMSGKDLKAEVEIQLVVEGLSKRAIVVEVQQRCSADEQAKWERVPLDMLRYAPHHADSALLQQSSNSSTLGSSGSVRSGDWSMHAGRSVVGQSGISNAHREEEEAVPFADDEGVDLSPNWNSEIELVATSIVQHRRLSEPVQTQPMHTQTPTPTQTQAQTQQRDAVKTGSGSGTRSGAPSSKLFRTFLGLRCDQSRRCMGEYEVCDLQWTDDMGRRGYCRCAPDYVWSTSVGGCVPEVLETKKLLGQLVSETTFDKPIKRLSLIIKALVTSLLSAKEGASNLNMIIGHALALGPGLLISAWTTKIIFAHSAIPGYFCYFFPWVYCPLAWGLYNLYYQLLPDGRVFVGLFILAFWPILMGGISMGYGLHKRMSIPRMMHVVNLILVIYYLMLLVGYGFLAWFVLDSKPSSTFQVTDAGEWLRDRFDEGDWSPRKLAANYIANLRWKAVCSWLVDSFAMFFFTCVAAADALIVCIAAENKEAWLMYHRSGQGGQDAIGDGKPMEKLSLASDPEAAESFAAMHFRRQRTGEYLPTREQFAVEEEVIQDWLRLIYELHPSDALAAQERLGRPIVQKFSGSTGDDAASIAGAEGDRVDVEQPPSQQQFYMKQDAV